MASVQITTTTFSPTFSHAHAMAIAGTRIWLAVHDGADLVLVYSDNNGASWSSKIVVDTANFLVQALSYDATNGRLNVLYAPYNSNAGALQFRAITSNVTSGTPGSLTTEVLIDAGGANVGVANPFFVHTDTGTNPRYWVIAPKFTASTTSQTRAWFVAAGSAADTAANWSTTNFTDLGANSGTATIHEGMGVHWTVGGAEKLTFVFMTNTPGSFEAVTFDPTAGTPTPGSVTAVASGYGNIATSTNLELFSINAQDDYLVVGLFDVDDSTVDFLSTVDGTTWNAVTNGTNVTMGRQQITRSGPDFYVLYSTPYGAMASTDNPLEYRKITASSNTIESSGHAFSDSDGNNLTVPIDTGTSTLYGIYRNGTASPFSTRYDAATIVQAFSLSADPGAFTVTGTAATIVAARVLSADPGAYTETGTAATVVVGRSLSADPGAYTVTGFAATLLAARSVTASPTSYAVTGVAATIAAGRLFNAQPASYALTGVAATLLAARTLTASPASYTVTGTAADLVHTPVGAYTLDCQPGAYTVSGVDAELLYLAARSIDAQPGVVTVTGTAATTAVGRTLNAQPASYAVTGSSATVQPARVLSANPGAYTVTGANATTLYGRAVVALPGAYTATGAAAGLVLAVPGVFVLNAEPGVTGVTGANATVISTRHLNAQPASYAITGVAAALFGEHSINASAAAYLVTGQAATVTGVRLLDAQPGTVTFTGFAASVGTIFDMEIDAATGVITITGFAANLDFEPSLTRMTTRGGRIRWNTIGGFQPNNRTGEITKNKEGAVSS